MERLSQRESAVKPPLASSSALARANERLLQLRQQTQPVAGSVLQMTKRLSYLSAELITEAPSTPQPTSAPPPIENATIKLYPTLGSGLLQSKRSAIGRVWLLLHHLDATRRGCLLLDEAKQHLTAPTSPYHLFSARRWREVLAEGEGLFWERDRKGRLWLAGVQRVAEALEVERLGGHPIALPLDVLLGTLRTFNAHLYAAFHAGRKNNNPISRATLEKINGVPARTQRMYDQIAHLHRTENYAVGRPVDAMSALEQEQFWLEHGHFGFVLTDHQGKHGKVGRKYVAWRLPNSYQSELLHAPRGRQKKINRRLRDKTNLVENRARGNCLSQRGRIFCQSAQEVRGKSADSRFWRSLHRGWWYELAGTKQERKTEGGLPPSRFSPLWCHKEKPQNG